MSALWAANGAAVAVRDRGTIRRGGGGGESHRDNKSVSASARIPKSTPHACARARGRRRRTIFVFAPAPCVSGCWGGEICRQTTAIGFEFRRER